MVFKRGILTLCTFAFTLIALTSTAYARNLITTPAGCNQEFRGNKGLIASCNTCVKAKNHFKKSTKGAWSCLVKSKPTPSKTKPTVVPVDDVEEPDDIAEVVEQPTPAPPVVEETPPPTPAAAEDATSESPSPDTHDAPAQAEGEESGKGCCVATQGMIMVGMLALIAAPTRRRRRKRRPVAQR